MAVRAHVRRLPLPCASARIAVRDLAITPDPLEEPSVLGAYPPPMPVETFPVPPHSEHFLSSTWPVPLHIRHTLSPDPGVSGGTRSGLSFSPICQILHSRAHLSELGLAGASSRDGERDTDVPRDAYD